MHDHCYQNPTPLLVVVPSGLLAAIVVVVVVVAAAAAAAVVAAVGVVIALWKLKKRASLHMAQIITLILVLVMVGNRPI